MNKRIVGVFTSEHEASSAIEQLKKQGFRTEDISVIARNKDDMENISEHTGTMAPEGVASGAATGGILGGLTGLLAGLGALAIPGIGPILAAGPIAATLAGAAVGAGTGGLVGGLIGLGIPEEEAEAYDRYVDEGRILVMVDADTAKESEIYSVFRSHGSLNSSYYEDEVKGTEADHSVRDSVDAVFNGSSLDNRSNPGLDTVNSGAVGAASHLSTSATGTAVPDHARTDLGVTSEADADSARKLRLREEQLDVSKNKVQTGEVSIHKEVIEEQKTIHVPVTHEEVVIERRAVTDETGAGPIGQDETIRIPVSEERVEVNKNTVVTGEVDVHKREVQETEQVQDTVRREEARIDRTGDARLTDRAADTDPLRRNR
ncbi:YsnF/AvaK domain-containing protein [Paenibacillus spiritus]|uniref:YsnF/AvaK domain-containing protein n=1 Tax=Paenibacillus spiritus TaxID=2496557 RepID=A0A5J5G9R9_9BACL|nr:YsnF/AvaK domain-containing protein [Paenibacillus spiritus]